MNKRKLSLFATLGLALTAVTVGSISTFAWFQINLSAEPTSATVQNDGFRTDALVYSPNKSHSNDDTATTNVASTADEGGTFVYDHSKDSNPADWYIIKVNGTGSLTPDHSIQMYKNKNNSGDLAVYYQIKFEEGDRFKIASGSRADWLGYQSVATGSTYYSNFSGETDTDGEKKIKCDTACVADVYVSDTYKIYIQAHRPYDVEPSLGKGAGYYLVGTSTDSRSPFYGANFEIENGFAMNYDTNVYGKSNGEAAYYGLHLYTNDRVIIWDGNGHNGWYDWNSVTGGNAQSLFKQGEIHSSESGTPYDYKCKDEGYYDFYMFGTMGEYGYNHTITIDHHIEGAASSGQSGNAAKSLNSSRGRTTFKTRATNTKTTRPHRIWYFYGNLSWFEDSGAEPLLSYETDSGWVHQKKGSELSGGLDKTNDVAWWTIPAGVKTLIFSRGTKAGEWWNQTANINIQYDGTNSTSGACVYNKYVAGSSDMNGSWSYNTGMTNTIVFNKNNASATGNMSNETIYLNNATLTSNGFSLAGYSFAGWSTSSGTQSVVYTNSQSLTYANFPSMVDGTTINLYAQWEVNTFDATMYVYNGNTSLGSFTIPSLPGDTLYYPSYTVSELFTNVSYGGSASSFRLDGYFTSSSFTSYYEKGYPTSGLKIYAKVSSADDGFANTTDVDKIGDQGVNYYIIGHSFTSGSNLYDAYWRQDKSFRMVSHSNDKGVAYISLKAGDQFKICDSSGNYVGDSGDITGGTASSSFEAGTIGDVTNNIKCKANGTYAIFFNSSGQLFFYSIANKPGYYLCTNASGSWTDASNTTLYRYSSGSLGSVAFDKDEEFYVAFGAWDSTNECVNLFYLKSSGATTSGNSIGSSYAGDGASGFGTGSGNVVCDTAGTYKISASCTLGSPNRATLTMQKSQGALSDGYYLVGNFNSWTPSSTYYSASLTATYSSVAVNALTSMKVYHIEDSFISEVYGWTSSSNTTFLVSDNGNIGSNVEFRYKGTYTITFDSSHNFGITSAVLSSDSINFNGTSSTFTRDNTESTATGNNVFTYTTALTVGQEFQVDAASNDSYAYGHWGWSDLAAGSQADYYASGTSVDSVHTPSNKKICSVLKHTNVKISFVVETGAITITPLGNDNTAYTPKNIDNATGIYFAWKNSDADFTGMASTPNKARMSYDPDSTMYKYNSEEIGWDNFDVDKKAAVKVTLNTPSYCAVLHNLDSFISIHDITQNSIKKKNDGSTYLDKSAGTEQTYTFLLPAGTYIIYLFGQNGCSPHYQNNSIKTYRVVAKAVTTTINTSVIHEVPVYMAGRGMPGSALSHGDYTTTYANSSTYRYVPFWAPKDQTTTFACYARASQGSDDGISLKAGDRFVLTDGANKRTDITTNSSGDGIVVEGSELVVKRSGTYKINATSANDTFMSAQFTITKVGEFTDVGKGGNDDTVEANDANPSAYSKDHGVRVLNASGSTINIGCALDNSYMDFDGTYVTFTIELRHINKINAGTISAAFGADLPTNVQYRMKYITQDPDGTDVSAKDNGEFGSWTSSKTLYSNNDIGINAAANTSYDTCYAAATVIEIRIPLTEFDTSGELLTYSWNFNINITFTEKITA